MLTFYCPGEGYISTPVLPNDKWLTGSKPLKSGIATDNFNMEVKSTEKSAKYSIDSLVSKPNRLSFGKITRIVYADLKHAYGKPYVHTPVTGVGLLC